MKLPIYEIFIEEDPEKIRISLVDEPAIESDFMFFNAEEPIKMVFIEDKMIVKGAALIPNKLMYRNSPMGERYVFYSEDTIFKFVEMLMNKKENKFNLLHTDASINAYVIESYFATEPNEFGVPKGSWIVSAKIKDPEVWSKIKSGELKGFSVEGMFSSELVEFSESFNNEKNKNEMSDLKEKIMSAISRLFSDDKPAEAEAETFTEEVKEDIIIKEEVAEEVFEMVDSQEVADNVEEVIDEAEDVVESVPNEVLTVDSVKDLLEQMKVAILSELTSNMGTIMDGMKQELVSMQKQVETFSNQPISESITEKVSNIKIDTNSKASKFFVK